MCIIECPDDNPLYNCQKVTNMVAVPFIDTTKTRQVLKTIHRMMMFGFKEKAKIETEIVEYVQPILEAWSGVKLQNPGLVFGIRRYLYGAWMMLHVDRLPTHVISAIIQVGNTIILVFRDICFC